MRARASHGFSFLEIVISVFLLSIAVLFVTPVFVTSTRASLREKQGLNASFFAQGIAERVKEVCKIYVAPGGPAPDTYFKLDTIYSPTAANQSTFNTFFVSNGFLPYPNSSITASAETAATGSKTLQITLAWLANKGNILTYNLTSVIARSANSFPQTPMLCSTPSTTTCSTTSTTSCSSTSTSTGTTTSTTSTVATTSTSTISTSSVSTSTSNAASSQSGGPGTH